MEISFRCRLASANSNATRPVTAGAAMLVPDFFTTPSRVPDMAASTNWPGADSSGLSLPSLVGPALEVDALGKCFL